MSLEVHLVTPEREVWSGTAQMLIAHGVDGEVGILAGHAPLLVRLSIGVLRLQTEHGDWQRAVIDGGFLHVTSAGGATRVDVLATGAEMAADVDRAAAGARAIELEAELGHGQDDTIRTELEKARVRTRLDG